MTKVGEARKALGSVASYIVAASVGAFAYHVLYGRTLAMFLAKDEAENIVSTAMIAKVRLEEVLPDLLAAVPGGLPGAANPRHADPPGTIGSWHTHPSKPGTRTSAGHKLKSGDEWSPADERTFESTPGPDYYAGTSGIILKVKNPKRGKQPIGHVTIPRKKRGKHR